MLQTGLSSGFLSTTDTSSVCSSDGYAFIGGPGLISLAHILDSPPIASSTLFFISWLAVHGRLLTRFPSRLMTERTRTFYPKTAVDTYAYFQCGTPSKNTFIAPVVGRLFHTQSTLTLKVSWNIQSGANPTPWFGIKDVQFEFATRQPSDVEAVYIGVGNPSIDQSSLCPSYKLL